MDGFAATRPPPPPYPTRSRDGSLPRGGLGRDEARPVPPTRPAGHVWASWPRRTGSTGSGAPYCRTRTALLTSRQTTRLKAVFAAEEHIAVEVTWRVYQQIIDAYAHPDPRAGKTLLTTVIDMLELDYQPGSRNWPSSDAPCTGAETTSWPTSPTGHPTAHRSHQRPPRRPPPQRTRLPQCDQLPHPITTALRRPRTLDREAPLYVPCPLCVCAGNRSGRDTRVGFD